MRDEKIGEKSNLEKCRDCSTWVRAGQKWCADCFEVGLSKDMDEHFKEFFRQEMNNPTDQKE